MPSGVDPHRPRAVQHTTVTRDGQAKGPGSERTTTKLQTAQRDTFSTDQGKKPRGQQNKQQADQAIAAMDALFFAPITGEGSKVGSVSIRDAYAVNDKLDGGSRRRGAAERQLNANTALETQRLQTLDAPSRAKYVAVKEKLVKTDPVAALALQKLLFEGRLPGRKDSAGEGTFLDHAAKLADGSTPLAPGISGAALLGDMVQEIAVPQAIAQAGKGTCAPTTLIIELAMENPAEYARVVSGLASPAGLVKLAGGMMAVREAGTQFDDRSGRSVTQRLLQPAFMEIANGDRAYENETDAGSGAGVETLNVLAEQLFAREEVAVNYQTPKDKQLGMFFIETALQHGSVVPAGLEWGDAGGRHKVLVTGETTGANGEKRVCFINPWGREEQMPLETFQGRLHDVNIDAVEATAAIDSLLGPASDLFRNLLGR